MPPIRQVSGNFDKFQAGKAEVLPFDRGGNMGEMLLTWVLESGLGITWLLMLNWILTDRERIPG